MREILFRGRRVDNGEWVYGLPYKAKYGGVSAIVNADEERFLINPETIGQYTGLTDKNGKKIFEGDVVKYSIYGAVRDSIITKFGEVIFSDQCFMPLTFAMTGSVEIITNIHVDPVRSKYLQGANYQSEVE